MDDVTAAAAVVGATDPLLVTAPVWVSAALPVPGGRVVAVVVAVAADVAEVADELAPLMAMPGAT